MALPPNIENHIHHYLRAFSDRDLDAVMALYADGATLEDPVGSEIRRGKTAIRAFYELYRDQHSYLQFSGDMRIADSAVAFSFVAVLGKGAEPHIVRITDTFLFDDHGLIKEMRAFWGTADIGGVAQSGPAPPITMPFAGRVAIVTAAHTGLGRACAVVLARQGARLILAGSGDGLAATRTAIEAIGGQAAFAGAESLESAKLLAIDRFGRLDQIVTIGHFAGTSDTTTVEILAEGAQFSEPSTPGRKNRIIVGAAKLLLDHDAPDNQVVANFALLLVSPANEAIRDGVFSLV